MRSFRPIVTSCSAVALLALSCLRAGAAPAFYVGNTHDNTIRAVDAAGNTSVVATLPGAVNNVQGLAFDSAGNLYAASQISNVVTKIAPDGTQSLYVSSGLNSPQGIAFDSQGNLYVANLGYHDVVKVSPAGLVNEVASGISNPYGLAVDFHDNLFIANYLQGEVLELSSAGSLSVFASGVTEAYGLAFDDAGDLYVMGANDGTLTKIAADGTKTTMATGFGDSLGVYVDATNTAYVADYGRSEIWQVASDGTVSIFSTQVQNPAFLVNLPRAPEICDNGVDDNGNGLVDCADPQCSSFPACQCIDLDGDGYGNPASPACAHPQLDCDDHNPNVNPGMAEVWNNHIDDDCNPATPPPPFQGCSSVSRPSPDGADAASLPLADMLGVAGAIALLRRRSRPA